MKKIMTLILTIILSFSLAGCFGLGNEETTTTELITVNYNNIIDVSTPQELQAMEIDRCYRLVSDIDLTGLEWIPLGDFNQPFLGNLDGNGHTISNLTITEDSTIYSGLFGYTSGNIVDLILENVSIDYQTDFLTYAGAVAGYIEGTVENVSVVNATINVVNTDSNTYAGLLTGYSQPQIYSYSTPDLFVSNELKNNNVLGTLTIESEDIAFVGGLSGKVFNSHVLNNLVDVEINVTMNDDLGYIGGLIGHNYGGILKGFEDSVEDANIYIEENVVLSSIDVTLNEGNISIGGLNGYDNYSTTSNNYADSDIIVSGSINTETEVRLGTFLGENWSSKINKNVSVYSLVNNLSGEYILTQDTIFEGLSLSDEFFNNNYISVKSGTIDVEDYSGLTSITSLQAQEAIFYLTNLEWTQAFIDLFLNE